MLFFFFFWSISELFDDCRSGEGLEEANRRLVQTSDSDCNEKEKKSDDNSSTGQPLRKKR